MVNVLTSPKRIEQSDLAARARVGVHRASARSSTTRAACNLVGNGRVAGAVGGIFGNPNDLALNMVVFLPLGVVHRDPARQPGASAVAAAGSAAHGRRDRRERLARRYPRARRDGVVLVSFAIRDASAAGLRGVPRADARAAARARSLLGIGSPASPTRARTRPVRGRRASNYSGNRSAAFLENPLTGVGAGQFKNWNPEGAIQPWHESHKSVAAGRGGTRHRRSRSCSSS